MSMFNTNIRSIEYDPVSESYTSVINAGIQESVNREVQTQNTIAIGSAKNKRISINDHICDNRCSKSCILTPKKSDIYHKIKSAHDDIITGIISKQEKSGTLCDGTRYEKQFIGGLQMGDWAHYSKGGSVLSAASYRGDIPIYNHAYDPDGNILCAMSYDYKTGICIVNVFSPDGSRILVKCNKIEVSENRGKFKLQREWYGNGHLKSEQPMYIAHDYTNDKVLADHYGDTRWGVCRQWYPTGQLKEEKYFVECEANPMYSRDWDSAGKCRTRFPR
jgi:hypothetical protein